MYLVNVEIKATQSGYKAKMSFTDSKDKLHEKLISRRKKKSQMRAIIWLD